MSFLSPFVGDMKIPKEINKQTYKYFTSLLRRLYLKQLEIDLLAFKERKVFPTLYLL